MGRMALQGASATKEGGQICLVWAGDCFAVFEGATSVGAGCAAHGASRRVKPEEARGFCARVGGWAVAGRYLKVISGERGRVV